MQGLQQIYAPEAGPQGAGNYIDKLYLILTFNLIIRLF